MPYKEQTNIINEILGRRGAEPIDEAADQNFKKALDGFVTKLNKVKDDLFKENKTIYAQFKDEAYIQSMGKKYVRISEHWVSRKNSKETSHDAVFCFIDKASGDVLMAAGYKAPAKGVRGNIFSDKNGMEAVSHGGTVVYHR